MKATELDPLPFGAYDTLVRRMRSRGFAAMRVPLNFVEMHRMMHSKALQYFGRSDEEKLKHTIQTIWTPSEEGPDDGCFRKTEHERKWVFHWRDHLAAELRNRGVRVEKDRALVEWLKVNAALDALYRRVFLAIYQELDKLMAEMGCRDSYFAKRCIMSAVDDHDSTNRSIAYDPPEYVGQDLGGLHIDRDDLTAHAWETHPGCVLHDGDTETLLKCVEGIVVFFFGRKAQLASGGVETDVMGRTKPVVRGGLIQALPHRIMAAPGYDITNSRFSGVIFNHCRPHPTRAPRSATQQPVIA